MKITAIIPARYASTRFEGKALADILGKPMVQHVYERVARASLVSEVIVATDDERIVAAVQAFGGRAEMTDKGHETGTDRLAEVAARSDADIIVNVQGDEPLIEPAMIDEAIRPLVDDPAVAMATLKTRIKSLHDFLSPNVVKVVTDWEGFALYFSRSPLPNFRDKWNDLKDEAFASGKLLATSMSASMSTVATSFSSMRRCPRPIWNWPKNWSSLGFWRTASASRWWRQSSNPSG